jgi:methionyl-tRNA formyltransferase
MVGMTTGQRDGHTAASGVRQFAMSVGTASLTTPAGSLQEVSADLARLHLDYVFVAGWPFVIEQRSMQTAGAEFIGLHPRDLPGGRGRSPIPWTIDSGQCETALTAFRLSGEVDGGDIVRRSSIRIRPEETATTLFAQFTERHIVLGRQLADLAANKGMAYVAQEKAGARVWPRRGLSYRIVRPDMSMDDLRILLRAQSPPFPPALVAWGGRLAPIDSLATLSEGRRGNRQGIIPLSFECTDGPLTLRVSASEPLNEPRK